jgi:hypothetical protein
VKKYLGEIINWGFWNKNDVKCSINIKKIKPTPIHDMVIGTMSSQLFEIAIRTNNFVSTKLFVRIAISKSCDDIVPITISWIGVGLIFFIFILHFTSFLFQKPQFIISPRYFFTFYIFMLFYLSLFYFFSFNPSVHNNFLNSKT